jgi:leucyl/phenylalanyl-tRNA--protein transferase
MVLFPAELHVSRSLGRRVRAGVFAVTADTCFRDVITACADTRRDEGTWISPAMIDAYSALHVRGVAHSVEAWANGRLVGGLYGVAIGRVFYGESMFARHSDASKVAFVYLVRQLARWGFGMIDCQMSTSHLASLGAREIPRAQFIERMRQLTANPSVAAPWRLDADLAIGPAPTTGEYN